MPEYVVVDKNGNVVEENSTEAMRRVPKSELKAYQAARGIKKQPEPEPKEKAAEEPENKAVEGPAENKGARVIKAGKE